MSEPATARRHERLGSTCALRARVAVCSAVCWLALCDLAGVGCVSKSYVGTSGQSGAGEGAAPTPTYDVMPPQPTAAAAEPTATAAAPPAIATRPVPIAILGEQFGQLGFSNAIVGDLDGDGLDDFVLADVLAMGGVQQRLAVYVFYGRRSLPSRMFVIEADAILRPVDALPRPLGSSLSGDMVRPLGDINGDGLADFAIEALGWFPVVLGSATRLAGNLVTADVSVRWAANGAADPMPLATVHGAGDVNGDGFDDLLVNVAYLPASANGAAPGVGLEPRSYLIAGHPDPWTSEEFDPREGLATAQFVDSPDARTPGGRGTFAFPAGDADGDGFRDVIVVFGVPPIAAGIFYGGRGRIAGTLGAAQADATLLTWAGPLPDLDGDLRSELAWLDSDNLALRYGSGQRLYGAVTQLAADFTLRCELGASAANLFLAAGDLDGDGLPNLIAADPMLQFNGFQVGAVYAVRDGEGRLAGTHQLDPTQVLLYGQAHELATSTGQPMIEGDRLGYGLASGGDINGDGSEDVLVGAPNGNGIDEVGGTVYLLRGSGRPPQ